jgi:formamidase
VRIPSSGAHNRWHPEIEPVGVVAPGDIVTLETRDGLDGQLTRSSTHADCARFDDALPHPLTGPLFVDGAEPRDVLEVELLAYETPDFGVNCVIPGFGFLADVFTEPFLVPWELDGGVARSPELPGIAVPACVHAGVIGVAPSHTLMEEQRAREERIRVAGGPVASDAPESALPASAAGGLRTIPPRETGGNVDIRRLVAGSTLLLPVHVPGALLSLGDVHFAQGDGEVCGTGIEIASAVTLRLGVRKAPRRASRFPAYVTPAQPGRACFATTGIPEDDPMDLTVAARAALLAMIDWLESEHGLERAAAYCLCSACVDLHLSQVVDIPYPLVSALIPLDVFERDPPTV